MAEIDQPDLPSECECCGAAALSQQRLSFAEFRHFDFETVCEHSSRIVCQQCGAVFHGTPRAVADVLRSSVGSFDYANSRQTERTILVDDSKQRVTPSYLQASLLAKHLPMPAASRLRFLDVGCFDGRLLVELQKRYPLAQLHGLDVNPHLGQWFPQEDAFRLHQSSLEHLTPAYDLITLSHSLTYLPELGNVLAQLRRLLSAQGYVYVQTPDLDHNPCSALLGDQYRFFNSTSLLACFRRHGFTATILSSEHFPRETIVLASVGNEVGDQVRQTAQATEPMEFVNRLQAIADNVRTVKQDSLLALGTTMNAAFVDSLLGNRLAGFVDENQQRQEGFFRAKLVHSPKMLKPSDVILLPYGPSAVRIANRFRCEYQGQFICV